MSNQLPYDRLIAKLQHFANMLHQTQIDKENLLLIIDHESCEKDKLRTQIFLCQELEKEYYQIFDDILYR